MTLRLCSECVTCEVDGCGAVAYCLGEYGDSPCPHDRALCGNCNLTVCVDCRLEAEADMHAGSDYDPRQDPFFDHTAPPPVDRIERDGGYQWGGQWVTVPRKGHTP